MTCRACSEHRRKIKEAAQSGSVVKTTVETVKAMQTFNKQMINRFSKVGKARLK